MNHRHTAWAVLHRSSCRLDGLRTWFEGMIPGEARLFKTRELARKYIKDTHGYIAHRPDLRGKPHGWRMPIAVRVEIIVSLLCS
jgi:hypothetical protein